MIAGLSDSPNDHVVGIDGGGTRSSAIALSLDSTILAQSQGGALNHHTTGPEVFRTNLTSLLDTIKLPGICRQIVVGTAGLFESASQAEFEEICQDRWKTDSLRLVGDAVVALAGATMGQPGVLVISGTGSIAVAMNSECDVRCSGGYGYMAGGDPGSAYWIAVQAILAADQHRAAHGDLDDLGHEICAFFETADLPGIVPRIYAGDPSSARLAGLCAHLCRHGSMRRFEDAAGEALAALAKPLLAFAGMPGKVYVSGSVLQHNRHVRDSLASKLVGCELATPLLDAATGAAVMALRAIGQPVDPSNLQLLTS